MTMLRGNTTQCAFPNQVHLWPHAKPLDATIGKVPTPIALVVAIVINTGVNQKSQHTSTF
jgi:hypothetical protein